jgi:glycosyltransferase involved in cell wall biosynthesis
MRPELEVLHYVGYDDDRGGIVSVVRALAQVQEFHCVLGVNHGARQERVPPLVEMELPRVLGEKISVRNFWRARVVARAVEPWLAQRRDRIFHGHSRAGLLVALWLRFRNERRVVASVHCYGRQRWFYRLAARGMGSRLYWLSPAMKRYYEVGDDGSWSQCVPGCAALNRPPAPRAGERQRGPVRLGGIGALVGWKRWELVLEALAALPAAVRGRVRFEHIGTDDRSVSSRATLHRCTGERPSSGWHRS